MYRFILAFRYLRARKITYFSVVGVALGVAVLIVVLSVMEGFQRDFRDRFRGMLSDIIFRYRGDEPLDEVLAKIETVPHVVAAAPRLRGMALLGGQGPTPVETVGISPEREPRVSQLGAYALRAWRDRPASHALLFIESYFYLVRDQIAAVEGLEGARTADELRLLDRMRSFDAAVEPVIRELREEKDFGAVRKAYGLFLAAARDSGLFNDQQILDLGEEIAGYQKLVDAQETTYEDATARSRREGAPPLPFSSDSAREILLGEELATRGISILVGQKVQLVAGSGRGLPSEAGGRAEGEFTVVGTFKSGMYKFDNSTVFLPLAAAQEFQGREGLVSEIGIRLDDFANAPAAQARLREIFPGEDIRTWAEHRRSLLQAINLEKAFLAVILFMIIVVAGFIMLATFLMMVTEKTRDLGILKALGGSPAGITSVFLIACTLIGLVGAGAGTAAGLAFAWNVNAIEALAVSLGIPTPFPHDLYYMETIPVVVEADQIFWIVAPTVLLSVLLGGVLPALKAARMQPLDALRHE